MRSRIILTAATVALIGAWPVALYANAMPHSPADATGMKAGKGETVEDRINSLHAELKITPDEESKWTDVAQAMRDNATNMDKMMADKKDMDPSKMTAKDDLETYQKFAQAHVDGLKNLRSAFDSLYDAMPEGQQKIADQVFQKHPAARHS